MPGHCGVRALIDTDFQAINGIRLIPGGAVSPASMQHVIGLPNGVALVAMARAEALSQGYPISAAALKMDVFARNLELSKAGLRDAYDDALDADDLDTAMRLAAKVGYPWDETQRLAAEGSRNQQTKHAFTFTRVGDRLAAGLKPISWLVRDYLEADSLALMFGDPACGKSFAAIDLACCIATGTHWHGRTATPGAVFYIAGEGQNGLDRRFAAWSQGNGISLRDAPLFSSSRPAMLCSPSGAADVANAVQSLADGTGQKPALIVVDTLARNFGGDENSQEDMGAFIANLDVFLRKSGEWSATVLVVHHSGHADKSRSRGSSALKGAVDAEYSLTKDESGIVRVEATKMKDAESPGPAAFRMEVVELEGELDDEGHPVTSVVLRSVLYVSPAKAGKVGRGRNQTLALSVLSTLHEEHRKRLSASGHNPEGARVKLDEWRDRLAATGIDRKRFYDLRNTLKEAGRIFIEFGDYVRLAEDERPF
jgi:hypothetical protein